MCNNEVQHFYNIYTIQYIRIRQNNIFNHWRRIRTRILLKYCSQRLLSSMWYSIKWI